MFAHHCSQCDQRRLVFPSQITGIANTNAGIVLDFVCWCGAPQSLVTGRRTGTARVPASAA